MSPSPPLTLNLQSALGPWTLVLPTPKLLTRASLPGAFGYDLAADGFLSILTEGIDPLTLLPAAMPTSWMVNNKPVSRVFQRWLTPPLVERWSALISALHGLDPTGWLALPTTDRDAIQAHVAALCIDGHGVVAVSKVLTLLCPSLLFLMDDAALWLLGVRPTPPDSTSTTTPLAGPDAFLPALDAFALAALANADALTTLTQTYPIEGCHPCQLLDRLLWFESWGWRLFREGQQRWWWLRDAYRQAVIPLRAPPPPLHCPPTDLIDLADIDDSPWRDEAQHTLSSLFDPPTS